MDAAAAARPRRSWGILLATWLALSIITSLQVVLSASAVGSRLDWSFGVARLAEGAMVLLYVPAIVLLDRLVPAERVGMPRHLAVTLAALAPLCVGATILSLEVADLVVRMATEGRIVFQGSFLAKGITEFITLGVAVILTAVYDLHRRLRERDTQALQLEARLAEARLQALSSQLHPHFLFNTLTAVSVLVHRDPAGADAMLTRLADLLRATLRQGPHEITLGEELALLDRYLGIMRIRYGPRLAVRVEAPAELRDAMVPAFVLQPLAENALEHGVARRAGPGSVTVRAAAAGDRLRLEVVDDGPGLAAHRDADGVDDGGIGLSNTRRRLAELYGERQRLALEQVPGVGTRALVELPLRRGAAAAVADEPPGVAGAA